jgi:hypothetical protein
VPKKTPIGRILGLCLLALVIAGAAVIAVPKLVDSDASSSHDGSSTPIECTAAQYELNNGLSANLTAALQKHSKKAFLALSAAPAAKTPMSRWWDNTSALGIITGGASPDRDANPAEGRVRMRIGFHNAMDSFSKDAHDKRTPDTPATEYQLGTKTVLDDKTGNKCHLKITSWKSLSNAPWDVKEKLYVVKTKHTVTAGEPRMKSEVRRVSALAEQAAAWDFGFFKSVDRSNYIDMSGFLVFVPATPKEERTWFRAPTAKKPSGWTADVGSVAGVQFPLPGVQLSVSGMPDGSPKLRPLSTDTGGGRVIINAAGRHEDDLGLERTLVHEFVHAIFANDDIGAYLDGDPVPGAVAEGAARWIESYFVDSPTDSAGKSTAWPHLKEGMREHFGSFDGHWPSNAEIYGSSDMAEYYYDLAASTFDYEASYGAGFALQCVLLAYTNGGGPFTGVELSNKGGNIKFANPAQEQSKWAAWVRQMMAS